MHRNKCVNSVVKLGCSYMDQDLLFNSILVILFTIIATILISMNSFILVIYIKKKDRPWTFINFSFITLLFFNILGGLSAYMVAYGTCYSIDYNYYYCLFKFCNIYFIGLMMTKLNFLISIERLVSVRWASKYKRLLSNKIPLLVILVFVLVALVFSFSPLIFKWNHFIEGCECAFNHTLPDTFQLIINFIFFVSSTATTLVYFYIYFIVKSVRKRIANSLVIKSNKLETNENWSNFSDNYNSAFSQSEIKVKTIHSPNIESKQVKIDEKKPRINDKIRVLKIQTIVFFVFFLSWFPFIFLVTYEIFDGIHFYSTISKIRNVSVSLIMLNGIVNPIIYTYRLKFMKGFFAKASPA